MGHASSQLFPPKPDTNYRLHGKYLCGFCSHLFHGAVCLFNRKYADISDIRRKISETNGKAVDVPQQALRKTAKESDKKFTARQMARNQNSSHRNFFQCSS
ncbi:uncharacterized protein LOC116123582 [Pistacia vera]|uniref:uncharacterized protein LOC116123582 n=1 Tax=Pistacia vera TaxID=55513 RepID=UPI00126381AC|nr:uncharacterized protein LOC116123582 [Pistacia vera]